MMKFAASPASLYSKRYAAVALALVGCWCVSLAAEQAELPAQVMVRTNSDALMTKLRADIPATGADPKQLLTLAETIALPHFDFPLMSQRALGKYWKNFSDEQRARFAQEFRRLLLRTYAGTLNDFREAKVDFLSPRQSSPDTVVVRTTVTRPTGGAPIPMDYEVRQGPDGWKVCNVSVSGISLVISYRAGLAQDIDQLGVDGLIAKLVDRNKAGP